VSYIVNAAGWITERFQVFSNSALKFKYQRGSLKIDEDVTFVPIFYYH